MFVETLLQIGDCFSSWFLAQLKQYRDFASLVERFLRTPSTKLAVNLFAKSLYERVPLTFFTKKVSKINLPYWLFAEGKQIVVFTKQS